MRQTSQILKDTIGFEQCGNFYFLKAKDYGINKGKNNFAQAEQIVPLVVGKIGGQIRSKPNLLKKLMEEINATKVCQTCGGKSCPDFSGARTHEMNLTKG